VDPSAEPTIPESSELPTIEREGVELDAPIAVERNACSHTLTERYRVEFERTGRDVRDSTDINAAGAPKPPRKSPR
jgi:hypothetical protein